MKETRPKVLALYRGVLELLDEGADVNGIKVSDITARAGIGKGTAYDYFKSREEIIACALLYDVEQKIEEEKEELDRHEGFRAKVVYAFDWMERRFREKKVFVRILRLTTEGSGLSGTILEELQKRKESGCGPIRVLWEMCREGKENGEIREDIPTSAACITTLANMAAFVMYLEKSEQMPELNTAWMKEFLCNGLLNQLE